MCWFFQKIELTLFFVMPSSINLTFYILSLATCLPFLNLQVITTLNSTSFRAIISNSWLILFSFKHFFTPHGSVQSRSLGEANEVHIYFRPIYLWRYLVHEIVKDCLSQVYKMKIIVLVWTSQAQMKIITFSKLL